MSKCRSDRGGGGGGFVTPPPRSKFAGDLIIKQIFRNIVGYWQTNVEVKSERKLRMSNFNNCF
jgi:hypothetical protein